MNAENKNFVMNRYDLRLRAGIFYEARDDYEKDEIMERMHTSYELGQEIYYMDVNWYLPWFYLRNSSDEFLISMHVVKTYCLSCLRDDHYRDRCAYCEELEFSIECPMERYQAISRHRYEACNNEMHFMPYYWYDDGSWDVPIDNYQEQH